jgi:hypothetical protein
MKRSETATELDFLALEQSLKEQLLRLYYLRCKLEAQGAAEVPSLRNELQRIEHRSDELISLWASLRREKALATAERELASASGEAEVAHALLDRLREELERRAAERQLDRELGGL